MDAKYRTYLAAICIEPERARLGVGGGEPEGGREHR